MTTVPTPADSTPTTKARPFNICVASPEFMGPANSNPGSIAATAMAQALAAAGHVVTCLYLGAKNSSPDGWERWVEKYKRDGVTLVALPPISASQLVASPNLVKSYETYHWLKRNDRFDIIHFPDRKGSGYHTLTAKHHGLGFLKTTICVGIHSMTAWLRGAEFAKTDHLAEVDTEFIERRAVALADALVSPNDSLLAVVNAHTGEKSRPKNKTNIPPTNLASDETVRAAVQALSVDPSNTIALKTLSRIYMNAGLHEAAREACYLILEHSARDREAQQMIDEATALEAKLSENLTDTSGALRRPAPPRPDYPTGLSAACA